MIVHIHDNLLLSDVQERFSKCFQSLKLEFYSRPPSHGHTDESYRINPLKHIGEIRHRGQQGDMELKSWFTVQKVETDFSKRFGLHIRIFRWENGDWVQIRETDASTLAEHQAVANNSSRTVIPGIIEQDNVYDEL